MIDGKRFANAIAAARAARLGWIQQERQRLSAEIRQLEQQQEIFSKAASLDEITEEWRRELTAVEDALKNAAHQRDQLLVALRKEAAALRARLIATVRDEIRMREVAVAAAEIDAARSAFARELEQLTIGAQPSAAELAKAFHDLERVAVRNRASAHTAATSTSSRLRQGVVAAGTDRLDELTRRRDGLLAELVHHGPLSGEPPPLVVGISATDVAIVISFGRYTLEPLLRDLNVEVAYGFIGDDPLVDLRRELSQSIQ